MATNPWWTELAIRPEIVNASGQIEDVQMSLGAAVHPQGQVPPDYANPISYGQITHPTPRLTALLADIAIRLAGGPSGYAKASCLTRLNQGMGGGKSHAEIGAWHLAAHPQEFLTTDIGQAVAASAASKLGQALPDDLNEPVVVVMDLDNATPGVTRKELDGPFSRTLFERFLWRLFEGDANAFKSYREHWSDKAMIKQALESVKRPVLIVIDEIMDYVGNGLTGAGDAQITAQDMAFLRALLDSVNDVPYVAMLVAMIDPEKDRISLSADAKERQADLNSLLDRNGRPATVNEDTDFTAILRRRLFSGPPSAEVISETAKSYQSLFTDPGWSKALVAINTDWAKEWDIAVKRSYPFHPQLMHLAEQEWAKHSGYQNVRSTIRVFAATVYALSERANGGGWAPPLIGPGDLPLWNNEVREAILGSGLVSDTSLEANYRSIMQGDITNLADSSDASGQARLLDASITPSETWGAFNPHAHERAATMIAVASLMPRGQGRRGATEHEIKIASGLPGITYALGDADGVLARLTDLNSEQAMASVDIIEGKGGQARRYYINPETGAKVVYRQHRQSVTPSDRDDLIAATAQDLASSGPFDRVLFIDADRQLPSDDDRRAIATQTLLEAGIDDARRTRLVILDPAGFSLRNGMSEATMAAVREASGIGEIANSVTWASSAVFAVVNTQRRRAAREAASDYLAWQRTHSSPELVGNDSARSTAKAGMDDAFAALKRNLQRAFQHLLYVSQLTQDSPREITEITLDNDALTALHGGTAWKELAAKDKVFQSGQFTAKALTINLRTADYQRPLSELRDSFYQAPRLPLLPGGDNDLRAAIYAAVTAGDLRLVKADGTEVTVDNAETINLNSQGLRLATRETETPAQTSDEAVAACKKCGKTSCAGDCPCPTCGNAECLGGCGTPSAVAKSSRIKITMLGEVNAANNGEATALISAMFDAYINQSVTYTNSAIELLVSEDQAAKIAAAAEAVGYGVTVKPML